MPIVTEAEVKALLTPFHGRIRSVFDRAHAEVAMVEACRREHGFSDYRYPRTLADAIYDAMSNIVGDVFDGDDQVKVIFEPQSFKVLFFPTDRQPILARFKKGDEEGRGQNHPTQTVIAFNDPEQCLPGFPEDAACIDVTYANNELRTGIDFVLVVYRDGDRVLWSYPIDDAESGKSAGDNVLPFQLGGERPDGDGNGSSLVSPKKPDADTKKPSDD